MIIRNTYNVSGVHSILAHLPPQRDNPNVVGNSTNFVYGIKIEGNNLSDEMKVDLIELLVQLNNLNTIVIELIENKTFTLL